MRSDDEFIHMMKSLWNLSDQAPPPPVYKLRHKMSGCDEAPAAIQSHGDCITWNQEQSMLEEQAAEKYMKSGKKVDIDGATSFKIYNPIYFF